MKKFIVLALIAAFAASCSGAHYCPSYGKRSVEKPSTFKTKKPKKV